MPHETRIVSPGPQERSVKTAEGEVLSPPADWLLLPPGDAGVTRRVKAAGPTWTVQEKKGRKLFSRGIWAPAATIQAVQAQWTLERADPAYEKKQAAALKRREKKQTEYVGSFYEAVLEFLAFAECHREIAAKLASAVTKHATPVGSGTVARTERIPVEERAEAAVIAWMRHQTTLYDAMKIPRVRGKRREVRRQLAEQSRKLLLKYRAGQSVDPATCPLFNALAKAE